MLKNYFKIAWRNIVRHKTYSFINILGLSLGICVCIVIFLISYYEFSTDAFLPGKDRIYRIIEKVVYDGDRVDKYASAPEDIAQTAREKFTGFETIASYYLYSAKIGIPGFGHAGSHYDNTIEGTHRPSTILAEPEYFRIFDYDWLAGNAATALATPNTVVLTEGKARKYFGGVVPVAQILGRQLVFNDSLVVVVTGIVKDRKGNTDLPFSEFISFSSAKGPFLRRNLFKEDPNAGFSPFISRAFVKLPPGVSPDRLNAQLHALSRLRKVDGPVKYDLLLQPLTGMHFDESVWDGYHKAHLPTLLVLMGVAVFILLLAAINFINLSTALSIRRAREIGIRKVMGGNRSSIALQFLMETFLLTMGALVLSLLVVKPVLAAFADYIPPGVPDHLLDAGHVVFLLLLVLVTTLLAGFYPARVLSGYLPVISLKGPGARKGEGKWYFRKGLIIFQFVISLVFIISTVIISRQINYMRSSDLGFNSDAIVSIYADGMDRSPKVPLFETRLRELPGVEKVGRESFTPLSDFQAGFDLTYRKSQIKAAVQVADSNFIALYGIHLLAGRNLITGANRDSIKEFVINESLSKAIGFATPREAVGQMVYLGDHAYPIVGVVADFHENSYRQPIRPLAIFDLSSPETNFGIKLAARGKDLSSVKHTLVQIGEIWKQVFPEKPFSYSFLDDSIAAMYKNEQKTAFLMNVATALSIFISCMGLFGISMFTAGQRTKEIGIRKVLGASVVHLTSLLTRDFMLLIALSLVIASPVAWYIMHRWLQDYLYRAPVTIWVFLFPGLLAILLGFFTIAFQAIKAAMANPVETLRAE